MASDVQMQDAKRSYKPQPALERIAQMGVFNTDCEGHQLLSKIANKWTVLIVYALTQGEKRYATLKQQIAGISPKMLIQNLRHLERLGLIERRVFPTSPPSVDYLLTPLGESLAEPLAILGDWAYQHIEDVNRASEQFDASNKEEDFWSPK